MKRSSAILLYGLGVIFILFLGVGYWWVSLEWRKKELPLASSFKVQEIAEIEKAKPRPVTSAPPRLVIPPSARHLTELQNILVSPFSYGQDRALLSAVSKIDPSDIPRVFVLTEEIKKPVARDFIRRLLLEHWAKLEPKKALDYAVALPGYEWKAKVIGLLVQSWAQRDFKKAKKGVLALRPGQSRSQAIRVLIEVWPENLPWEILDFAQKHALPKEDPSFFLTLYAKAVKEDPLRTVSSLFLLPAGPFQQEGLVLLMKEWMAKNPSEALAWIEAQSDLGWREKVLPVAFYAWAQRDPQAAAQYVQQLPSHPQRSSWASVIAFAWGQVEGRAAMEWVEQLPIDFNRMEAANSAMSSWVAVDPLYAAQYAAMLPASEIQENAFALAASGLVAYDKEEAIDWIKMLPSKSQGRVAAIGELTRAWLHEGEQEQALRYLQAQVPKAIRPQALGGFFREWARQTPQSAFESAQKLPHRLRKLALQEVYAGWAIQSPQQAAQKARGLPQGEVKKAVVARIAGLWAEDDLEAAAAWATQLGEKEGRYEALNQVAARWIARKPKEAAQWLTSLPFSQSREAIIQEWATQIVRTDPLVAVALVESLSQAQDKTRVFEKMVPLWLNMEPSQARHWVEENTTFSPEVKERLLEKLKKEEPLLQKK